MVELMVSVTIGLILLAGVVSIFVSSRVTFSTNERTARLQENGRVALDLITHDLRSAGYQGCSRGISFTNGLRMTTSAAFWDYVAPIQGYENDGAGTFTPALTGVTLVPAPQPDSDVVVVRTAIRDGRSTRLETSMTALNNDLNVLDTGAGTLVAGVYMISDCNAADIFRANFNPGPPATLTHAAGTTQGTNLSDSLGYLYQAGARVVPLQTIIYYVGLDPANNNEPTLYRKIGSAGTPQPLIEGVQALQISYGEDTDNDRIANFYRSAAAVVNWTNIISVNVAMLIRSEEYGSNVDTKTYTLLTAAAGGKTIDPTDDRRMRMTFTTTAALRNRAW